MIYLLIAILCGAMFSVVFKICQIKSISTQQVILFNYITAALVNWAPVIVDIITGGPSRMEDYQLQTPSFLLAIMQGIFFMMGFIIMDISTWRNGVALTTIAARASLVMPVILSWMLLSQPMPSWMPIVLILVSMFMIIQPNRQQYHDPSTYRSASDEIRKRRAALALAGTFLFYGISDFSMKLVQHTTVAGLTNPELTDCKLDTLTGVIFIMAALASFIGCLITKCFRKSPIGWKSIVSGAILGCINMCCTSCTVRGLNELSTGLFYPIYNIGTVIIATIIGICLFKEKMKWLQFVGLLLAIIAIMLFFR